MSIIIRLQNLPWSASSLDIRRYFTGLSIPDGGVHIVGGEKGDAFIAFASDEDARQAMSRDGGTIKDTKIKLLLSSRNEMKSVVDQARIAAVAASTATSDSTVKMQPQQQQQHQQPQLQLHSQPATSATSLGTSNVSMSLPSSSNSLSNAPAGSLMMGGSNGGALVSGIHNVNTSGTGLGSGSIPCGSGGSGGMHLNSNRSNGGTNSLGSNTSTGMATSNVIGIGLNTSSAANSQAGINHVTSRGPNVRARSRSPINRISTGNSGDLQPMAGLMPLNGNLNQVTRSGPPSYAQGAGAPGQDNWSRRVDFNANSNVNLAVGSTNGIIPNNNTQTQGQGFIWRAELRGLPFNVTPRDIQEFFRLGIGFYVSEDSIKILVNDRGFTTGGATVRFDNEADFHAALTLSGRMFGDRPIDVMPLLDDGIGSNSMQQQVPQQMPQQQSQQLQQQQMPQRDYVIYMKGIPFNMCTDRDVLTFFSGLRVTEVVFEFDQRTGKTAGNAFVEFPSKQDYEAALELNLRHMGRRYIEVFPTTRDDMEEARRIGYQVSGGPVQGMASTIPKHVNNSSGDVDDVTSKPTYCINITGLPPTITNTDLTTYFKEAGALPFAIHIMLKGNGFNAGEAFLEFLSQEHQRIALLRDGAVISDHRISVKDVPFNVMTRIVGRPSNPHVPPPIGQGSPIGLGNNPPGPGVGVTGGGGGPPGMGPGGGGGFRGNFSDRGGFRGGHRFNGPRMRGGGMGGNAGGGHLMAGCNNNGRGMSPNRRRDPFADGHCVVHASNVPYKSTNEDLREFFADFHVLPNGIERRLNERGQATPEARIAFRNSQEAERAVKVMHKKTLLGRQIFLRLAV